MSTTVTAPHRRRPAPRHARAPGSGDLDARAIELRLLGTHEPRLIRRLAALDDAPELGGQILVALIGGQAVAALSLRDQRVVANPFIPTVDAVALLRLRGEQLSKGRTRARRWRRGLR